MMITLPKHRICIQCTFWFETKLTKNGKSDLKLACINRILLHNNRYLLLKGFCDYLSNVEMGSMSRLLL